MRENILGLAVPPTLRSKGIKFGKRRNALARRRVKEPGLIVVRDALKDLSIKMVLDADKRN